MITDTYYDVFWLFYKFVASKFIVLDFMFRRLKDLWEITQRILSCSDVKTVYTCLVFVFLKTVSHFWVITIKERTFNYSADIKDVLIKLQTIIFCLLIKKRLKFSSFCKFLRIERTFVSDLLSPINFVQCQNRSHRKLVWFHSDLQNYLVLRLIAKDRDHEVR